MPPQAREPLLFLNQNHLNLSPHPLLVQKTEGQEKKKSRKMHWGLYEIRKKTICYVVYYSMHIYAIPNKHVLLYSLYCFVNCLAKKLISEPRHYASR